MKAPPRQEEPEKGKKEIREAEAHNRNSSATTEREPLKYASVAPGSQVKRWLDLKHHSQTGPILHYHG